MKILLATSELHPYSKTGGLADMVGALAKALGRAGHEVGVVTPLYRGILEKHPAIRKIDWWMDLPLGPYRHQAEVWSDQPGPGLTHYFIRHDHFYSRPGIYSENGFDYLDNAARFIFLSKCTAHLARHLPWQPEVVHVHDWQTGLVPILILHQKLAEGWWNAPRTVCTIHNLGYQGRFTRGEYDAANLPAEYFNPHGVEFYGGLNTLKAGISYADMVTTVSPRYAREITTPEYGEMLDHPLRARQQAGTLLGILNGVDYDEWNTTNNPFLPVPFDVDDLSGKAATKLALQKEMGLSPRADVPLFATVSRLAGQKGMDIQLGALEEMAASDLQFVLLGSGEPHLQAGFEKLARRHPQKVAIRIGFDTGLSHRIEAGADFFLMPSRYEPCGLNQMYSLRYGTLPIVRRTGGLDDAVIDLNDDRKRVNGIKFDAYSVRALAKAMRKALVLYREPRWLEFYQHNGMKADFSWERTAGEYVDLYRRLTGHLEENE
jgi:starch synthase